MGMHEQAIQNIHKSDFEFTDEKDNKIDLSRSVKNLRALNTTSV